MRFAHLADEVGALLLILLGDDNGVLEGSVIDLTALELWHNVNVRLLLAVLVEGKSVILLLRLARLALSLLSSSSAFGGGCIGRRGPSVGAVRGVAPLILGSGISDSGGLSLELRGAFISAPALVDLLVRVAGNIK